MPSLGQLMTNHQGSQKSRGKGAGKGKKQNAGRSSQKGPKRAAAAASIELPKKRAKPHCSDGSGSQAAEVKDSASVAGSEAKSTITRCSSANKLVTQTEKYMKELNFADIVCNKALGCELNNALRVVRAWQHVSPGCAEAVKLQARHNLAERARSLRIEALPSLSRDEREQGLKELMPHMEEIPVCWAASLYQVRMRDLNSDLGDQPAEADLQRWLGSVWPMRDANGPLYCKAT